MSDDFQRKTRDTLGKIIKKPPLTEKLLTKPPFRFLHDITTEPDNTTELQSEATFEIIKTSKVIRTTGFLNGLFTPEEMDSRNVSVKEEKMLFLQKIIDVVSIVSGTQLSVKPVKIVAGHEPEKTNELLQVMAKCINRNMSSDEAVQQVLSGKKPSKVQEKPPSGSSRKKDKDKPERKSRKNADEDVDRERSRDRQRKSGREKRETSRDDEEGAGEGTEERDGDRGRRGESSRDKTRDDRSSDRRDEKRRDSKSMLKDFRQQGLVKSANRAGSAKSRQPAPDKKSKTSPKQRKSKDKLGTDAQSNEKRKSRKKKEEDQHEKPDSADSRGKEDDQEGRRNADEEPSERPSGSGRPQRPASAKGHRRRPADRSSREESEVQQPSRRENSTRPARPPSARPAAPRVRQRPDPAEEEIARMESAGRNRTAPLIVDRGRQTGEMSSSDEDEQFLVQEENDVEPPDLEKLSPMGNNDADGEVEDEEHGGLVRKILETKKELESSASKGAEATRKKRTEIERTPVNEAQHRKEREIVMRDIEKLRASVQKLCRSAVPLGKIIDYIQEDMDSMQNELIQWKKENKEHLAKLQKEDSITVDTIKPLQAQLDELDRSIAAHTDMIAASKCNVIRNQEKIAKMIAGVTAKS